MASIALAYKYVAIAVTLSEINYCASRLHLPLRLPITERDLRVKLVNEPGSPLGCGGRFDTKDYSFTVGASRLIFVTKLYEGTGFEAVVQPPRGEALADYFTRMSRKPSLINTNGAYLLASNWLASISVDVPRLEKEHAAKITHYQFMNHLPLPIFEVKWETKMGGQLVPAVEVLITGDTKEIIHLRQVDSSYSSRPAMLIKDADALLAIKDEEFTRYSEKQRQELIERFSAVSTEHAESESTLLKEN